MSGREVAFFVEKTRSGFAYATTVDGVCHLLSFLPFLDWEGINEFVFRQPTSKQILLKPTWGRVDYLAELFSPGGAPLAPGPAIFLDAVDIGRPLKWSKHLSPDDQLELERLSADGHTIKHNAKSIIISSTYSSVRNTQLYRTLLHEIGHWVDYVNRVVQPAAISNTDYSELSDRFWSRPEAEREAFAHRYAESVRQELWNSKRIPFERIINPDPEQDGTTISSFAIS